MRITKNFTVKEMQCHGENCCNNSCPMDRQFMEKLQIVRDVFGKGMYPTCGFRCNKHNAETPGSTKNSLHTLGRASDIAVGKKSDLQVLADIAKNYFAEVIVYVDKNFVHIGDE